ncbi:hypothetical protein [Bacteroides sp.]
MGEYDRRQQKQESRAIAYNGGGSRQLKEIADNRKPNFQCEVINRNIRRSQKIIQRVVVHGFDEKMSKHPGICADMDSLAHIVGAPIMHMRDVNDYSTFKTIGILSHGKPGLICWPTLIDGAELAEKEFISKKITSGVNIVIWSCNAGDVVANDSLVSKVAKRLKESGVSNIAVQGPQGRHTVLSTTNTPYGVHFELNDGKEYWEDEMDLLYAKGFFPEKCPKYKCKDLLKNIEMLAKLENMQCDDTYINKKKIQWKSMCDDLEKILNSKGMVKNRTKWTITSIM